MERWRGRCEPLCEVDVSIIAAWIGAIPLSEWPQQSRISVDSPYPAMVGTHRDWHGIGEMVKPLVDLVMAHFPDGRQGHSMFSLLIPGQKIEAHDDVQSEAWRARIHIPILTNDRATFRYTDSKEIFLMPVGFAYLFNPEIEHRIENNGETDRVHFFFDILERSAQ